MQMNKILPTLFLFFVCFALPNQTFSQTNATIETLKGFDTLKVEVEPLAPDLEKAGITREQIQTDVEERLQRAGIKINKTKENSNPYIVLSVKIDSINNGVGGFAVSVTSSLNQSVFLDRNKSVFSVASTWESRSIVSVIKEKVQAIRKFVAIQTEQFASDYSRANASTGKQVAKPQL